MTIKRLIAPLLTALILTAGTTQAQERTGKTERSRLGIGITGGVGKVLVVPHEKTTLGTTIGLDANYTYMFNEHWGVMTGIGFNHTRSSLSAEDLESNPQKLTMVTTTTGNELVQAQYRCVTPKAEEHYRMTYAEIPIMLVLQGTPMSITIEGFHKCYVAVGAKIGLPLSVDAHTDYSTTDVSLWPTVPGVGVELDEPMYMGKYQPTNDKYKMSDAGNMMYVMASFEAGILMKLHGSGTLQASIFLDYAINHSTTENAEDASSIASNGEDFVTVGYLNSNNVSMFKYFKVGLKLQYNMKW